MGDVCSSWVNNKSGFRLLLLGRVCHEEFIRPKKRVLAFITGSWGITSKPLEFPGF